MLSYPKCSMILWRTNRGTGCRDFHNQSAGLEFLLLVQVWDAIYEKMASTCKGKNHPLIPKTDQVLAKTQLFH